MTPEQAYEKLKELDQLFDLTMSFHQKMNIMADFVEKHSKEVTKAVGDLIESTRAIK